MKKIVLTLLLLIIFQVVSYANIFEYVEKKDDTFKWEMVSQRNLPKGATVYEIKLTSQT